VEWEVAFVGAAGEKQHQTASCKLGINAALDCRAVVRILGSSLLNEEYSARARQ